VWILTALFFAEAPAGSAIPGFEDMVKTQSASPRYHASFRYDGKPSEEFLQTWEFEASRETLDRGRVRYTLRHTDPVTGLAVRCEGIEYANPPVSEWTLHFKNTGEKDTPILSDIKSIDTCFRARSGAKHTLHHHTGDLCTADSYEPHESVLEPNSTKQVANTGGRPTQSAFPYFNIEWEGEGLIFVVSWAGQWAAEFIRDATDGLRLKAGQELTHFRLRPGEEVRTPLVVILRYKGGWLDGQNLWRRWMIDENLPRPGGQLPPVPQLAACSSHQFGEMINANTDNQILFINQYLEKGIVLDYWWMDAGWYINKTGWPNTGTWEVDTNRFRGGLRPICDHAHSKGVKSLVWFEPERVTPGTWLYENHPEWLLGKEGEQKLFNLGLDEARAWLTNHVDDLLNKEGIDLYRQDFNMDPLPYWRANDTEDRQGITEIKHVMGYFAYWDELQRRHPNMLIDSCASGGRRNDLETLRRAVPLLRSDYIMEPVGNQCHTYALSFWFPFYGTGTSKTSSYEIRSVLCPHFIACWDMRSEDLDYPALKKLMDEWKEFAPSFMGDYYPLTPYSLANDQWIAWQFDRPGQSGMVQAFRRAENTQESMRFPLQGLDPAAQYRIRNLEAGTETKTAGKELMEQGLLVSIPGKPSSGVWIYEPVREGG
jgi:alpha-galactosidase